MRQRIKSAILESSMLWRSTRWLVVAASCGVVLLAALSLMALSTFVSASAAQTVWGSFLTPFSADSRWNSRPINPVLSEPVIPASDYVPSVSTGAYSTGIFEAVASDPPMTVTGPSGMAGIWDADMETFRPSITLPHWPANVLPAVGTDGHADVADISTGIIHSFWQLKQTGTGWTATQYAWSKINGSGWGNPAHYFQGARATGVATSAGLIRKHEIDDGRSMYQHALAMSLTFNALGKTPPYVFPATSADKDALTVNSGTVPQGALLMLPRSFDMTKLTNPRLRKIAETLKTYGAYVVDRNYGTPFIIYVENGSGFDLHNGGWNNAVAVQLDYIRTQLRRVVAHDGWLDGNGVGYTPQRNFNLLSMRGPWVAESGAPLGVYGSWAQALVFPALPERVQQTDYSSRALNKVSWATPHQGDNFKVIARTTGGGKLRLRIKNQQGVWLFDSGELDNGSASYFTWPSEDASVVVIAISGVNVVSTVRGDLVKLNF
jgi:hypothetical protein